MKYKTIGLLAVAAAAMMASAASASADYLSTTTGGAAATPTIHAVNEGGHVSLENDLATISCSSTTSGTPNTHGTGENVSGPISTLTFTGCTNSWHVTTLTPGSLSVIATGGHGGFLYSNGAWIEMTRFGVKCIYETFNTSIGTIWGGNPATISINALIPLKPFESSGLCGSGAASWEGSYVTTSALYFAQS